MVRGTLKGAIVWATKSWSARSSAEAPLRRTTAAATSSPRRASATPKVTACATVGCSRSTSSTSSGEIFSPPRLMISFSRPWRCRWAFSSRNPRSPVRNQPSAKAAAFATGSPAYPPKTFSPRIATSPTSPQSSMPPSSSRIVIWGPAAGPTDPGLRVPGGNGLLAIWCAASVMPYASMTGMPVISSSPCSTGTGSAADDDRTKRSRWDPSASGCSRSRASTF